MDPTDESRLLFQPVPIKIINEPAEQIGLDHVARYSKTTTMAESTASKNLGAQFGAIASFAQGLSIAHDYVKVMFSHYTIEGNFGQLRREVKRVRRVRDWIGEENKW